MTVTLTVAVAVADLADGVRELDPDARLVTEGRGPDAEPPAGATTVGGTAGAAGGAFAEGDARAVRVGRAGPDTAGLPGPAPAPVRAPASADGTGSPLRAAVS
ncbi:MAG TPA: hypothetical protein VME19_18840 [Streptosporangiaceae bacterium]|nr:hypothetical protein [Streptosporangiaceae bacterium]